MAVDIPVWLCTEKDADDSVVHLSRTKRPDPTTIYCKPHELLEFRRKVYRATGQPGALNVCRACQLAAGPHAAFVCAPPLPRRAPKPESAKARTVAMFGDGE